MSGSSTIGALRVVLGCDVASFEDGLKGAGKSLEEFSKQAKVAGVAIGAALSAVGIAIGLGLKNAVDQADKLGKLSQSMGVPVEQLSQMSLAAQLSGVSIDSLARSFSVLNKNMVEATGNAKSEAARAFQAMGISVKDANGNLKSSQQVFDEIAAKFKTYQDGAGKSALATAVFGRAGASLIPLLNEGADGIQRMRNEADQLGLTIDQKTSNAATKFNDNLTIMGKIWDGITLKITAGMLPSMLNLSSAMVEAGKNSQGLATIGAAVGNTLLTLATIAEGASNWVRQLSLDFGALSSIVSAILVGDFSKVGSIISKWQEDSKKALSDSGKVIDAIWSNTTNDIVSKSNDAGNKMSAPIIKGAKDVEAAVDSFLASQQKQGAKLEGTAAALTMTSESGKAYVVWMEAMTIATEKSIPLTDALMEKIYNSAMAYGQVAAAAEQATQRFNQLKQIGQDVGGAIASSLSDAIKNGGKFIDILKNMASKMLDIAFQASVTKPLQNIFGNLFSGSQAPIAPLFGFASGGSFNVGGSGGIDSQMVAFKASPNENVTVSKPGQGSGEGGQPIVLNNSYTFAPGMTGNDMALMKSMIAQSNRQTIADIQRMNRADCRAMYR